MCIKDEMAYAQLTLEYYFVKAKSLLDKEKPCKFAEAIMTKFDYFMFVLTPE